MDTGGSGFMQLTCIHFLRNFPNYVGQNVPSMDLWCVCVHRVFGVSGNIYTGQFLGGELHGQGLLRTPSGEQYEGDFIEGRKEGMSKHTHVWT